MDLSALTALTRLELCGYTDDEPNGRLRRWPEGTGGHNSPLQVGWGATYQYMHMHDAPINVGHVAAQYSVLTSLLLDAVIGSGSHCVQYPTCHSRCN